MMREVTAYIVSWFQKLAHK